ncbi:MAG: asparagine synthetase B family protein, partial [Steroidobacteraceae bacterium]
SGHAFEVQERRYWMPQALAPAGASPQPLTDADAVDRIEEVLAEAVRLQMVADVPVGAFLSGGIDSSLIVALMQRASTRPVRTFSIGLWDEEYNEAPFARSIAKHLGTQHTELMITPNDALAVIPRLPDIYDEPFADSSQIPMYLVSQLARRDVTVSLSGDGGDELFGGYPQYPFNLDYWRRVQRVPAPVRATLLQILSRMPLHWIELMTQPARWVGRGQRHLADRIKERSAVVFAGSFAEHYRAQLSFWQWPGEVVMGAREPDTVLSRRAEWPTGVAELAQMMYIDTCQYLPDDILVKVDRAAMAVSLETRVPLLDPQVARAVWSIPLETHNRGGTPKWVLRQVLARHVPPELFERPKRGFSIPVGRWLRNELRDWAGDLLDGSRLRRQGILEPRVVARRWQQHRDGIADWSVQLWTVLMFQAWLERWQAGTHS